MISVEFETPEPIPAGGELRGYALWSPDEGQRGSSFDLVLRWRTEGRGRRDSGIVARHRTPLTEGIPAEPVRFPFRFLLPPDGPVSYHGHLLSILWEVEARLDVSWAIDPKVVRPVLVVPRVQ